MCSTFKLLAAAAVLHRVDGNEEQLTRVIPYTTADLLEYAPITKEHVKEGGMTLAALCAAAVEYSDNTAANLLLQTIGGPEGFTRYARSLGDQKTRLDRLEPDLNSAVPGDERDTTTPAAMLANLRTLLLGDALSQQSRQLLDGWLAENKTGDELIRAGLPNDWKIGDKTGRGNDGATNDIAIIRPPGKVSHSSRHLLRRIDRLLQGPPGRDRRCCPNCCRDILTASGRFTWHSRTRRAPPRFKSQLSERLLKGNNRVTFARSPIHPQRGYLISTPQLKPG